MIKGSFLGLAKCRLTFPCERDFGGPALPEIPTPPQAVYELPGRPAGEPRLTPGERVSTGQLLRFGTADTECLVSTVSGVVARVSEETGYLGAPRTVIRIDVQEEDSWDSAAAEALKGSDPKTILNLLGALPGNRALSTLQAAERPLTALVILGLDTDPLASANQLSVAGAFESLKRGLDFLRDCSPAARILLVVPPPLGERAREAGAEVQVTDAVYPDILPQILLRRLLGRTVPAGKKCEDAGAAFLSAESVAALGAALDSGRIPLWKTVAVSDRGKPPQNVRVRVGTPIREVLSTLQLEVRHGERLVLDGPFTGLSVFTEDTPVAFDTTSLLIQEPAQIAPSADNPCVNCGECVRACPTRVPVNMLIRLLENGLYTEAAQQYDLFSCIDCGLCSYVCIARIPVYHYIALGKHEATRAMSREESHA